MVKGDFGTEWYEKQLSNVDEEIARLAFLCDIRMLDPGIIERVVAGDASVCGKSNDKAFSRLRSLVRMHYSLTDDSLKSLGDEKVAEILARIRDRLRQRFDIGGTPG
jgi:hypothetical protein